jgi:hypothetical protein
VTHRQHREAGDGGGGVYETFSPGPSLVGLGATMPCAGAAGCRAHAEHLTAGSTRDAAGDGD